MTSSDLLDRNALRNELRRIGNFPDEEIDIGDTALLLAALDRPRVSLERYRHHLSLLTRDTADLGERYGASRSLDGRVRALSEIVFGRYAYRGDKKTYDNLQNANLMRVIDRRKGLPVSLGILCLHAARGQGWPICGLNFPGHFLLRLDLGAERAILDPFNEGSLRESADLRGLLKALHGPEAELRSDHTQAVGTREVLLRLQNNIKLRLIKDELPDEALAILESMLLIAPDVPALLREAGVLYAHFDNLQAAIKAFERFLDLSDDEGGRHEVARYLQQLRPRLN